MGRLILSAVASHFSHAANDPDVITVSVSVSDAEGAAVTGLGEDHFVVRGVAGLGNLELHKAFEFPPDSGFYNLQVKDRFHEEQLPNGIYVLGVRARRRPDSGGTITSMRITGSEAVGGTP